MHNMIFLIRARVMSYTKDRGQTSSSSEFRDVVFEDVVFDNNMFLFLYAFSSFFFFSYLNNYNN